MFKLIDGELSRSNVHVEVLIDDMSFPSYSSSRTRSKVVKFDESESDVTAPVFC